MDSSTTRKGRKMKVFLDDIRPAPKGWVLVNHPLEMITLLKHNKVKAISLDHDLGLENWTGYDVLLWLEKQVFCGWITDVPDIYIHTSNSSARIKMELARKKILDIQAKV